MLSAALDLFFFPPVSRADFGAMAFADKKKEEIAPGYWLIFTANMYLRRESRNQIRLWWVCVNVWTCPKSNIAQKNKL